MCSIILFHIPPQVRLPDHDFAVGASHKLIPSVYASCVVNDKGVTYSGPTHIKIG